MEFELLAADTGRPVTPEEEDARRRFLLTLRAMAVKRRKQDEDAAEIQRWADLLKRDMAAYRAVQRKRAFRRLLWGTVIASFVFGHNLPILHVVHQWWWTIFFFGGAGAVADATMSRRREMAGHLSRAADPRAVSVLAVACRQGDAEIRQLAARGLRNILPQMRQSDAQYVTPEGMNALLDLLQPPTDQDLVLPVLKGLEQIGDERAIPRVRAWAAERYNSDLSRAAEECLRYLEARVERERQRSLLLRPAAGEAPGVTLLRPAGAADTPAEALLRAADAAPENQQPVATTRPVSELQEDPPLQVRAN